jgi:hypothetical protein
MESEYAGRPAIHHEFPHAIPNLTVNNKVLYVVNRFVE